MNDTQKSMIKNRMIELKNTINQMISDGKSLKEISHWSYEMREKGQDIPYFAITDKNEKREIIQIIASPIKSQKDLYEFFNLLSPGCLAAKEFFMYVNLEEGAVLGWMPNKEHLSKKEGRIKI